VYARDVDDRRLTLAVSGLLWNDRMVLRDEETGSLWSHILGEAKEGPLKGKTLKQIPSVMTDWASWRERHPDGTVAMLSPTTQVYTCHIYARPELYVLGIVKDDKVAAWGFDVLSKTPVLNEKLGDKAVLVVFHRNSGTARLYERTVEGRVLTFHMKDDQLRDQETDSTWDSIIGRATGGPLQGKFLVPLPAIVSYRVVWQTFHPKSELAAPK
jgi:hypothetical protein